MTRLVRTVVADRCPDQRRLLRLALARDPEVDVVAEAADGPGTVAQVEATGADLLVLDADLPLLDGVAVVGAVRSLRPSCACVFVTSLPIGELRAAGAVGVVPRSTPATMLAGEIRAVAAAIDVVDVAREEALVLSQDTLAPRTARRFVDDVLAGEGYDDVLDIVQLLVTEVVTNAVLHARTDATVVVRLLDDAVRVEVVDGDESVPVRRRPRDDQPGGRGLELVEQLSRSWGIEMLETGKRLWFEVDRQG